jgi:hypothetical protein
MLGLDYLGLGHVMWPVEATIRLTPAGTAIGCFDNTFGDVFPNLGKLLASGKFPVVRSHIWWDDAHRIVPLDVLRDRVPYYEALAKKYPKVKIYISHSCEHNEYVMTDILKRIQVITRKAPSCIPVNCVWQGRCVDGFINEKHGTTNPGLRLPYITSNDGSILPAPGMTKFKKANIGAELCFLWDTQFNIARPGLPRIPPKERTKPPTQQCIKEMVSYLY